MTISRHVYSAQLPGGAEVRPIDGTISLDAGRSPHITASLTLPMPGRWDTAPDQLGEWRELRRNLFPNPAVRTLAGLPETDSQAVRRHVDAAVRWTFTTTSAIGINLEAPEVVVGTRVRVRVRARASRALAMHPRVRSSELPAITIGTGWQWYEFTGAGAGDARFTGFAVRQGHKIDDWVEIDRVLIVDAADPGDWFSALTTPPPRRIEGDTITLYRYRSTGTPDASTSVLEAAEVLEHGGPVFTPDAAALAALDPRDAPRMTITAGREGEPARIFDLGVRSRRVNRRTGVVEVALASDEALLADFSQPYDQYFGGRDHRVWASILVQNVLGATLGADLESWRSDADLTPRWAATNLLRNPAVVATTANWAAGGGCAISWVANGSTGEVRVLLNATAAAVFAVDTTKWNLSCVPGKQYTFSVACRHEGSAASTASASLRFLDANGATISEVTGPTMRTTTSLARVEVTATAPPSAVKIAPIWRVTGGASGRAFRLDAGMLTDDPYALYIAPFTGADNTTDEYRFEFEGPNNDSASTRTPLLERSPESLTWKAGQSAMDFLHPLLQGAGLRLVCDERRGWMLRDAEYLAGPTFVVHQDALIDVDYGIDRDGGLWFDARITRYRWIDANGIQQERIDYFALPNATRTTTVDVDAPYPGPGRSEYAVYRARQVGMHVAAEMVSDWTLGTDQDFRIDLHQEATLIGSVQSITFDLSTDRMQITARSWQ